jgi:hypothetical protein
MTDIKQNAQALMDEVKREHPTLSDYTLAVFAAQRAIERHEAFRQKVSDAIENEWASLHYSTQRNLSHLIITTPKDDPLFDVLWHLGVAEDRAGIEFMANGINDALKARNLKIVEVKEDDRH